jgi:hypothetical protein
MAARAPRNTASTIIHPPKGTTCTVQDGLESEMHSTFLCLRPEHGRLQHGIIIKNRRSSRRW